MGLSPKNSLLQKKNKITDNRSFLKILHDENFVHRVILLYIYLICSVNLNPLVSIVCFSSQFVLIYLVHSIQLSNSWAVIMFDSY